MTAKQKAAANVGKHPLTVEDMLSTLGSINASADHNGSIAIGAGLDSGLGYDVWLVTVGGSPRRIIERRAGSGLFVGLSPGGKYLAVGTARGAGDDTVCLDVHDLMTGRVTHPLNNSIRIFPGACRWLGVDRLACVTAPLDLNNLISGTISGTQRQAISAWARQRESREPSASVLRSGPGVSFGRFGRAELKIIDMSSAASRTAAAADAYRFAYSPFVSSSVGKWIALRADTRHPQTINPLYHIYSYIDTILIIAPVDGITPMRKVTDAYFQRGGNATYYRSSVPKWSPDASRLAVLGKPSPSNEVVSSAYQVDAATGVATLTSPAGWQVADVAWTSGNQLLLYGCHDDPAFVQPEPVREKILPPCIAPTGGDARRDWWVVSERKLGVNLTRSFKAVPKRLLPGVARRDEVLAVADGAFWRMPADGSPPENLTSGQGVTVSAIVWPASADEGALADTLLLEAKKAEQEGWLRVTFDPNGTVSHAWILNPTEGGALAAYSPEAGVVVKSEEDTGTFIWVAKPDGARQVLALNTHLAAVQWPQELRVPYRGQEGDNLTATVLLPTEYVSGRRYPLVLHLYPGVDKCFAGAAKRQNYFQNVQLLAARGYVVACPEMPVPRRGFPANWRAELPKGVFGLIDKLVEQGFIDGERVGVIGHSFGGFATLSLVTMSNRFKAAVAMAPISNFLSDYGTFNATQRYFDGGHEIMRAPVTSELAQSSMAAPPWEDLQQYVMNSPVSYVNRVNTPVMLVHGDMDNLGIQQSEEFFTGLYRQGKRAQFVRYWGEGHGIMSPANVRDLWQRIYAWFDEFLKPEEQEPTPGKQAN